MFRLLVGVGAPDCLFSRCNGAEPVVLTVSHAPTGGVSITQTALRPGAPHPPKLWVVL